LALRQVKNNTIIAFMENKEDEKTTEYVDISKSSTKKEGVWDLIKFIIIAIAIVLPIRALIAQPFIVSGSSMFPTFKDNQYLIVDQISYRFEDPKRGDIVIFRYPIDPSKFFIKRVIGLPNENVSIENGVITITEEDGSQKTLNEPYLEIDRESKDTLDVQLKDGEYFVMGDNRIASSDSRTWGVLPRKNVIGKALFRLLPTDSISVDPGEYRY
jgi:signal peptidase I